MSKYLYFRAVREAYSDRSTKPRRKPGPKPKEFRPDNDHTLSVLRVSESVLDDDIIDSLLEYQDRPDRSKILGYCLFTEDDLESLVNDVSIVTGYKPEPNSYDPDGTEHWVIEVDENRTPDDTDILKDTLYTLGSMCYTELS